MDQEMTIICVCVCGGGHCSNISMVNVHWILDWICPDCLIQKKCVVKSFSEILTIWYYDTLRASWTTAMLTKIPNKNWISNPLVYHWDLSVVDVLQLCFLAVYIRWYINVHQMRPYMSNLCKFHLLSHIAVCFVIHDRIASLLVEIFKLMQSKTKQYGR